MNYERLIETVSEIYNNDKIEKNGLILVYELNEKKHKAMAEHLFFKSNQTNEEFVYSEEFEVEIGNIVVKFIKKSEE